MNRFYLLEAQSGLPNWYGCPLRRVESILEKNLKFCEQVYSTHCLHRRLGRSSFRILIEAPESQALDFGRFLLAKTNTDILGGSGGINVFSGGVRLEKLPSFVELSIN